MSKNKKHISFLADKQLFVMGIIWCVLSLLMDAAMIVLLICDKSTTNTTSELNDLIAILLVLALFVIFSAILALPKWYIKITLVKDCIIYRPLFRKAKHIPYNNLGYIQMAYYKHIFAKVQYIVLSSIRLSSYELQHINQVPNSKELIKIRYTEKTKQFLLNTLPKRHVKMLLNCLEK